MRVPLRFMVGVLLCVSSPTLHAQQGSVAGTVIAEGSLRPIAGAQVSVEGRVGVGAVTDNAGRFRVTNLTGTSVVLNVRIIGYRPLRDSVRVGATDLRFVLAQQAASLDAMVVTGTAGAQSRRELGNNVANISLADQVVTTPAVNLGQELNARVPGVSLTPISGTAGSGERIQLRGRTSLTLRTTPLIVVDGVRIDSKMATSAFSSAGSVSRLNDFDPSEMENVEVVLGPSAGTLYGTDASSGVLQLITKRGKPGPARVEVQIREGTSYFNDYQNRMPLNYYIDPATKTIKAFNLAQNEIDRGTPVYRRAYNQGYAINVSGGNDAVQYFSAFHANDDEGPVNTTGSKQYGGRLNLNITPHPSWDANAQAGFSLNRTVFPHPSYTVNALLNTTATINGPTRGFLLGWPADVGVGVFEYDLNVDHLTSGAEVRYRPTEWLSQHFRAGVDITNQNDIQLTRRMSPADAAFFPPATAAGSKNFTNTNTLTGTFDYGATAVGSLSSQLKLTTAIGAQYYRSLLTTLNANGRTFPTSDVTTLAGAATTFSTDNYTENVTAGVYGQAQLTWRDRLYVVGALRADGASNFGKSFGLATYPKMSVSWVLSEEPFFKFRHLDDFRVRAALGTSGQQPIAFAALRTYLPVTGPNGATAVTPNLVGNDSLAPERAREIEAGFDASMFNRRITFNYTFYDEKTTNAIIRRDVAPSSGFPAQQFVNAGALRNRGWEALLNLGVLQRRALDWDVGFGLSTNENKVETLGIPGQPYLQFGTASRFEPGFPAYAFFTRRIISADRGPNNASINILCDGGLPGDLPGGVGVPCATAPRLYQGRIDPKWMGKISSSLSLWNKVVIQGLMDYKTGFTKIVDQDYCGGIGLGDFCRSKVAPQDYSPIVVAANQIAGTDLSQWFVDAGFARFRELSVSYALPSRLAALIGAASSQITVAGRNLGTWSAAGKGASMDPESTTFPDGGSGTFIESEIIPQLRYFTLMINLKY